MLADLCCRPTQKSGARHAAMGDARRFVKLRGVARPQISPLAVGRALTVAAARAGDAAVGVLGEARKAGRQKAEAKECGEGQCEGTFQDPSPLLFRESPSNMGISRCGKKLRSCEPAMRRMRGNILSRRPSQNRCGETAPPPYWTHHKTRCRSSAPGRLSTAGRVVRCRPWAPVYESSAQPSRCGTAVGRRVPSTTTGPHSLARRTIELLEPGDFSTFRAFEMTKKSECMDPKRAGFDFRSFTAFSNRCAGEGPGRHGRRGLNSLTDCCGTVFSAEDNVSANARLGSDARHSLGGFCRRSATMTRGHHIHKPSAPVLRVV